MVHYVHVRSYADHLFHMLIIQVLVIPWIWLRSLFDSEMMIKVSSSGLDLIRVFDK